MVSCANRELKVLWLAFRHTKYLFWTSLLLSLIIYLLLSAHDRVLLTHIQSSNQYLHDFAKCLSKWGHAEFGTVLLSLIVYLIGWAIRNKRIKQAACVALVAGLMAGILVDTLRPTFGRARPDSGFPDGLYGIHLSDSDFQSLPSGHAISNSATVMGMAYIYRPLMIPAVAYSAVMAWSRLEGNKHHPLRCDDRHALRLVCRCLDWHFIRAPQGISGKVRGKLANNWEVPFSGVIIILLGTLSLAVTPHFAIDGSHVRRTLRYS